MPATDTTARPRPLPATRHESSDVTERMPPHDPGAEAGVLGSIIIDPPTIETVRLFIRDPDAFYDGRNADVFSVLCEIHDARRPIDGTILRSTLETKKMLEQVGGIEYIRELAGRVPSSAHVGEYAAIVAQKHTIRRLISACTSTLRDCYESGDHDAALVERAQGRIHSIAEVRTTNFPTPMSEIVPNLLLDLSEIGDRARLVGTPTGFIELDNVLGGLLDGDMIVIAARPSVGKTAFAVNIIEHVCLEKGKTGVIFSLEMKKDQLAMRMLCSRAVVDSHKLKRNELSPEEQQRIGHAAARIAVPHIFIDDTPGIGLPEIRTKCMRLKERNKLGLVAVDYLGLMKAGQGENQTQRIGALSNGLKQLGRELNVPILCLSQLNRDCESEGRIPRKSDLRDSGNIEQDADVIILLHREVCYHRGDRAWLDANHDKLCEALAIIEKQRNGPTDTVKLTYLAAQTRFTNYQPGL